MKNKIKDKINKHTFFFSLISTLVVFLLFWALNGFRFANGSYEEYAFSMLISGGDGVVLFLGVFLSEILVFFQSLLPFVNVFSLFLILSGFCSFVILNYILLKKLSFKLGLLLSLALDCIFMNVMVISFQWTHTATIICLASVSLVFYSVLNENRRRIMSLQFTLGFLGIILSSQLRFDAAKVCLAFACLFCLCVFVKNVFDNDEVLLKKKLCLGIKKTFTLVLTALLLLGAGFVCDGVSEAIKNTDETYKGYVDYNNIRSKTEDYPIAQYESNKDFYDSIGIYSKGDFDLLTCFKLDKDFFTIDRLETISDYAQEHDSGIQNIYLSYFNALRNKTVSLTGNGNLVYLVLCVAGIAILALIFFLYKIRNRIKILFLILFFCMWGAFLLYLGIGTLLNDMLLLVFLAVSMIIILIGNRYQYAFVMIFNTGILLLYNYMAHVRLGFRVAITFILPAIFFLLMLFEIKDIRKRIVNRSLRLCVGIKAASVLLPTVALVVFVQSQIGVFSFNTAQCKYDSDLINYISSNSNNVYLFDWYGCELVDHSKYNPLMVPDYPENSVHYGSWPISSHLFENQLNEYNIKHLHEEMINSTQFRFIISKDDERYIVQLEDYYKAHYCRGTKIELIEDYSSDKAWVYRVVINQ